MPARRHTKKTPTEAIINVLSVDNLLPEPVSPALDAPVSEFSEKGLVEDLTAVGESFPTSPRWGGYIKNIVTFVLALILLVAVIEGGIFLYLQTNKNQGASKMSDADQKDLVKKVGKLIELPTTESPTIATVTDTTKLSGQSFFSKAQNGDKVLIFANAKKAILYRPGADKIIEVGPITLAPSVSPTVPVSGVPVQIPSVKPSPTSNPTSSK